MLKEVKAVCKRCSREVGAEYFVLDTEYKMMVCPFCIKEKKSKILSQKSDISSPNTIVSSQKGSISLQKAAVSKPSLSKASLSKPFNQLQSKPILPLKLISEKEESEKEEEQRISEQRISDLRGKKATNFRRLDQERVKMTCQKCRYEFVYNEVDKYPASCPYCNGPIFMFQFK